MTAHNRHGHIELEDLTIPALMGRSFGCYGDLPAFAFAGEPALTYAEVEREVEALAHDLADRKIRKGQKVAVLGENSPQWVTAYLAIMAAGAAAVPILPAFPDSDARHIIRDSEAVAVFVSANQAHKVKDADLPAVHSFYSLETLTTRETSSAEGGVLKKAGRLLLKAADLKPAARQAPADAPTADDLAVILYTSGTTGHSKGVMLSHRNIVSDVVGSIERFPIASGDRFLSILPLSHVFEATGGMLCPLAVGASIFYMRGLPAPRKLLSAMQTVRPTGVLMVPLIMDKIYRKRVLRWIEARRLSWVYRIPLFRRVINRSAGKKLIQSLGGNLRFFMLGGAHLNEDLELFLRDAGISYSTGYGMTEAAPILTISPFGKVRVGSCGRPLPGVEIRIANPEARTGIGEILVRGPNVMKGYYRDPEATRNAFLDEGWMRTGDLGLLDNDGYLYIKGRSKNVIVGPSGENIYPEIIEQRLLRNRYIQQVIVYGREGRLIAKAYLDYDVIDEEFERQKLSDSEAQTLSRELLERARAEVNDRLPAFSAVCEIREQPEPFEMTPTNKVKRYLYVD
jgi:long-chain acyl-CoA synthetase